MSQDCSAVCDVERLGPVYTPPERRGRGYASAVVAAMSRAVLGAGNRCILYADLDNPTSNAIYRALGYSAVAEALRYGFDDAR
jgi:predicted GNAT family acetyltransferase